ncbi:MAG: TetR/AcrR family transcriptional regulator [Bacteroidia bacterium]|nr:TetR/AcrR family transcriptional regulator [Bacteroidia bacterium]
MDKLVDQNPGEESTERRILDAARKVFYQKGLGGARMAEIAEEAGINKALLHYYFRSKEQLFQRIFEEAFHQFFPKIAALLSGPEPVEAKIRGFVSFYTDLLREHPHLPIFVLNAIQSDPDQFAKRFITDNPAQPGQLAMQFIHQMLNEMSAGKIRPVDPRHLIINTMAMTIFPYIARPLLMRMMNMTDADFDQFVDARRLVVPQFVMQAIQPPAPEQE